MLKSRWVVGILFLCTVAIMAVSGAVRTETRTAASESDAVADARVDAARCLMCHREVATLWNTGKHKGVVQCADCHTGLARHVANPRGVKPTTNLAPDHCGTCHQDQYSSFFTVNEHRPARVEKSNLTERSPNPLWEKLMMGHGFTAEHNAPRSHAWMLVDHLAVDRAYGGRFQPQRGWLYTIDTPTLTAWDVLRDEHPETNAQRSFQRGAVAAANPTCLKCKTTDHILDWKYMGDPDTRARWSRTSNVVEMARSTKNPMGCIMCHDPHATGPRIVRDALIDALTRSDDTSSLWQADPKRTGINVVEFRGFRRIATLERYDAKLQCGQCHVEYACNPGIDPTNGARIGFGDSRTNHFPFRDVLRINEHYNNIRFFDFRHALTGALLTKAQHPEVEAYWNSTHDRAGVSCNDCHMPKLRNAAGDTYTSHWQTNPRRYLRETCMRCHSNMTEARALYAIDSIKRHTQGKMRKAEFWIGALIDKIVEARGNGTDTELIRRAQVQHQKAHILWEWWTAENSDGFHNPEQAKRSLNLAIDEAKAGIAILSR